MTQFPLVSLNGAIVPREQAAVSLFNIEYTYGFGVYETLRVVHSVLYFLDQHVERLLRSAQIIGLRHVYDAASIRQSIQALTGSISEDAYNIKILLVGAKVLEDVLLAILPLAPSFPQKQWYRDGVPVLTVDYERALPGAKTLNMLLSYLSYAKAKENSCYDALLVDRDACVREGTRTNIYMLDGKTIISPPAEKILEGVSRMVLQRVAAQEGFGFDERDIPLAELKKAQGVCLSSTSSKLLPIRSINGQAVPIPDVLHTLVKAYETYVEECGGVMR